MKTINFLTSHFLPENTACTNRVLSYVKILEQKYKVNVISLTQKGVSPQKMKISYTENINIYYVEQKNFNGKNFFIRAFYEILYIKKLINLSNRIKGDIVIATTPYMFMIPLVSLFVKHKKVLDIRDLVWEYLDEQSFSKKIIKFFLRFMMKYSLKKFDSIIVTNEVEREILKNRYFIKNMTLIPNGIEEEKYLQLVNLEILQPKVFTITYIGNIGLAQNLVVLLEAAKVLKNSKFYIIGDGIELEQLKKYVLKEKIENVSFLGKLEWNDIKVFYAKSSVLYAQLDRKYKSAIPSKLYEYAAVGLPIIYAGDGAAVKFLNNLENIQVIPSNDKIELIKAIDSFQSQLINLISKKNRDTIKQHYLRDKNSIKLLKILDHLK